MIRYGIPPNTFPQIQGLDYSESGFRKSITFLRSPAVGATFIALSIFFLIVFLTNTLFNSASLLTIGIIVTLSVLAIMGLIVLILFFL